MGVFWRVYYSTLHGRSCIDGFKLWNADYNDVSHRQRLLIDPTRMVPGGSRFIDDVDFHYEELLEDDDFEEEYWTNPI